MPIAFIDTSFYMPCCLPSPSSAAAKQILEDPAYTHYIAELAMVEWISAAAKTLRESKITRRHLEDGYNKLLLDIATKRIRVFPTIPGLYDKAIHVLRYAAVTEKRALRTLDALILVTAIDVAHHAQQKIDFFLSDERFANLVKDLEISKDYVDVKLVQHSPEPPPSFLTRCKRAWRAF